MRRPAHQEHSAERDSLESFEPCPGTACRRSQAPSPSSRRSRRRTPDWGVSDLAVPCRAVEVVGPSNAQHTHRRGPARTGSVDGRYRLGLALFDLAAAVPSQRSLHEAVLLPMTDLRNSTGETVQVGVLDGRQVVYVERLDSPNTLRLFTELGRRNDAHCTGSGKALLAFLPKPQLDKLREGVGSRRNGPSTRSRRAWRSGRVRAHSPGRIRREPTGVRDRRRLDRCTHPRRQRHDDRRNERRRSSRPHGPSSRSTRRHGRDDGTRDLSASRLSGSPLRRPVPRDVPSRDDGQRLPSGHG